MPTAGENKLRERMPKVLVVRYKRAAVSQVAGIKILDGAPVIEGKVSAEKSSIQICTFLGRYVVNQVQVQHNSGGEFVGWGARAGPRADRDSQL